MAGNVTWSMYDELQVNMTALQRDHAQMVENLSYMQERYESMVVSTDTFWLLSGSILVLAMQPGFTLLEVGGASAKHTKNILIKNVLDTSCSVIAWWSFGHGFAFSRHGDAFVGRGGFMSKGDVYQDASAVYGENEGYHYAYLFFQLMFCGTTATIVSGAVGERITLTAYFFMSFMLAGFIYPLVVRWGWSAHGWASASYKDPLLGCGVIDFSGSGVVHTCGGSVSICAIKIIGPRLNRWSETGKALEMPKQSAVFVVTGSFILLVGWFGFNGMSTLLCVGRAYIAAKVMLVTALSAASAAGTSAVLGFLLYGATSPDQLCNGMLAGLVAITAGCATVEPEGGVIIGATSAYVYMRVSDLLLKYKLDDSVDAVPVHLGNGVWGMIAAGLFSTSENYAQAYYSERADRCCGFFYGCGLNQLAVQVIFTLSVMVWSISTTFVCLKMLQYLQLLRVGRKAELNGVDSDAHGGEEVSEQIKDLLNMLQAQSARSAVSDNDRAPSRSLMNVTGGGNGTQHSNLSQSNTGSKTAPSSPSPAVQKTNGLKQMVPGRSSE